MTKKNPSPLQLAILIERQKSKCAAHREFAEAAEAAFRSCYGAPVDSARVTEALECWHEATKLWMAHASRLVELQGVHEIALEDLAPSDAPDGFRVKGSTEVSS